MPCCCTHTYTPVIFYKGTWAHTRLKQCVHCLTFKTVLFCNFTLPFPPFSLTVAQKQHTTMVNQGTLFPPYTYQEKTRKISSEWNRIKWVFQIFTRESFPCDVSCLDYYTTHVHTQVHIYIHTHKYIYREHGKGPPWHICRQFLARHEARQTQKSNNEKGDKEDWQFFPLLCRGKSLLEYVCVGICIVVCQRLLYAC